MRVQSGRLALAYSPSDRLRFDFDMMYVDTDMSTYFGALTPTIDPGSVVNFYPQSFEPHEVYSELDPKLDSIVQQASLTVSTVPKFNFDSE